MGYPKPEKNSDKDCPDRKLISFHPTREKIGGLFSGHLRTCIMKIEAL